MLPVVVREVFEVALLETGFEAPACALELAEFRLVDPVFFDMLPDRAEELLVLLLKEEPLRDWEAFEELLAFVEPEEGFALVLCLEDEERVEVLPTEDCTLFLAEFRTLLF